MSVEYKEPLNLTFEFFENRYIHEGWVVDPNFDNLVYVRSIFSHIGFECLLEFNEQIVPHFILEFYSQYYINYDLKGQMFVEFVFQNQLFSFSLEEFGQILCIPYEGDCSFSNKWSLDDLPYSVPTGGPYQTNPPYPDDIKLLVQIERQGVVTRIRHEQEIIVEDNQILTREITDVMKTWVDIIQIMYFVLVEIGIMSSRVCVLSNPLHVLYDRVIYLLAAQQERKTRKDYLTRRGRSSASSSSAFGQPSSSHPNDDDNDEGTSVQATPSPTRFVSNSLAKEFSSLEKPTNVDLRHGTI
ncbi:hypothetical protein Tco_1048148 [Tanacetum coccineum]